MKRKDRNPPPLYFAPWRRDDLAVPIPAVLLDRRLRIMRTNEHFTRLLGQDRDYRGTYLTGYYYESLGEQRINEIHRSVMSPGTGYSYSGRVTAKGDDNLVSIAHLMIFPLFQDARDRGKPSGYLAVLDDIGPVYRELLSTTFSSLLSAARLKDNDTGNHIERVNRYAGVLAESLLHHPGFLDVDRQFVEDISVIASLHDVGKIGTPDDILNKAGPLEPWEWEVMKEHTINGAYLMANYPNPMAREVTLRHHEHWDGTGYPHGVGGELIPLSARIAAVADVYDALRMRRTYKDPMTHGEACDYLTGQSGTHFDPMLISQFEKLEDEFEGIYEDLRDKAG